MILATKAKFFSFLLHFWPYRENRYKGEVSDLKTQKTRNIDSIVWKRDKKHFSFKFIEYFLKNCIHSRNMTFFDAVHS